MATSCNDDLMKNEFIEDESIGSAQALMTLHDSVQNMPKKHKSALQEAVLDASPIKKFRPYSFERETSETIQNVPDSYHVRKQLHPSKIPDEIYHPESMFTLNQTQTMKGLLNNINNLLKQSAGRRWVYYEWFYSNIDRALLLGENDFQSCLRQLFKDVKIKKFTRTQWSMIRRLMGKPRRCSPAFFAEERHSLEEKRKKIRYLHQLKGFEVTDMTRFKDLPDEIPMPMVIGTKVAAKVNPANDGLRIFTGTVDAVDNVHNTYRVTFAREGIGKHSISDIDVASEDYEAMNLQLFMVKERPKIVGANSPPDAVVPRSKNVDDSTTSASSLRLADALSNDLKGTYGGFPVRFLLYLTKLSKLISLKKKYVNKLKEMNSKAELLKPYKRKVTAEFQKNYAFLVLELEKINKELSTTFSNIHNFMHKEAPQLGMFDQSTSMKQFCDSSANELVDQSQRIVSNLRLKDLVTKLTSVMLQINCHAELDKRAIELSSLDEAIDEIKSTLHPSNIPFFEDKVETQIAFIKNGLQQEGSMLAAFRHGRRCRKKVDFAHPTISSTSSSATMLTSDVVADVDIDDEEEIEEIDDDEDDDGDGDVEMSEDDDDL